MGCGEDGLVVAYSPIPGVSRGNSLDLSQSGKHSPYIFDDCSSGGNVITPIDIVLHGSLWDPNWQGTSPSQQFLQQSGDVWQIFLIREFRQAFVADNSVEFLLGSSHDVRVEGHYEEETFQEGQGLNSWGLSTQNGR